MSVVILSLNAQFVHTSPIGRRLRNIACDMGLPNVYLLEHNINEYDWKILNAIVACAPEIIAFSVYIWNKNFINQLAQRLRVLLPHAKIVAGGPEISYRTPSTDFDVIFQGSCETCWPEFLAKHFNITCLAKQPTEFGPYREGDLSTLKNRLVYLETSIGCPFSCAFCLSGRDDCKWQVLINYPSTEYKQYLETLAASGVRTIKFLDRTFNASPARALIWFKFFASIEHLAFHFEICAELLNAETLEFLQTIPMGKFQFEIGIQSLNIPTLKAIGRNQNIAAITSSLQNILNIKAVHVHVDLIWGLPLDTQPTIEQAFNTLFAMSPNEIQLGFLKFLAGAPLENIKEQFNYLHSSEPPYEVWQNSTLTSPEILFLQGFANIFNIYWNSKRFINTIKYLLTVTSSTPFALFATITRTFQHLGLLGLPLGLKEQYLLLTQAFANYPLLVDFLRLDYVISQKVYAIPIELQGPLPPKKHLHNKLTGDTFIVSFAHELNTATLAFAHNPQPAYYAVQHHKQQGYTCAFEHVTITRLAEIQ